MAVPERRVWVVLSSLLAAMTLASSLLLALEPRPVTRLEAVPLQIGGAVPQPLNLFETDQPIIAKHWRSIVIYDSLTLDGTAATLAEAYAANGIDPLPYHFVIGLGNEDGEQRIEVGPRWMRQTAAQFAADDAGEIAICLIGDTDRQPLTDDQLRRLVWLVRSLQAALGIDEGDVAIRTGATDAPDAGRLFPTASFRRQLLRQSR